MDSLRFPLICVVGVILFFLYQAWQQDYADTQPDYEQRPPVTAAQDPTDPTIEDEELPEIGAAPEREEQPQTQTEQPAAPSALETGERILVETDLYRIEIDTHGGDIRQAELVGIPVARDKPEQYLKLLNDVPPNFFILQSGLIAAQGESAPDHRDRFTAEQRRYVMPEGADSLEVPLSWRDAGGRVVEKAYIFHRGRYEIDLIHRVSNQSGQPWQLSPYARYWRLPHSSGEEPPFIQSFMGAAIYEQQGEEDKYKFTKYDFEDIREEPAQLRQTGGWISMQQHYFLGAIIPPETGSLSYFAKPKPVGPLRLKGAEAGYVGQQHKIEPGATENFAARLYVGPKLQDQLGQVAPGLELSVDYGMLTIISEPLFWVLAFIHSYIGNWGWAIIIMTVVIKLAFYKLSEAQYRSMARMRKFAPRIKQLKERYGDDRQQMQQKMMELYKKEGFNPFGGCWPMLVQIPVFLALYWVLLESVELRQAPWILWINDLSAPDPYFVLPVLFGISMWLQQKLSASTMTMDPTQQKIMQVMPIGLAAFFTLFPVGLVLYWLVNNLISVAQQWWIYRKLDKEGLGKTPAKT